MKKIINAPEAYTDDMLRGIYAAHPDMVKYVEDDLRCYCTAKRNRERWPSLPAEAPGICRCSLDMWVRTCWTAAGWRCVPVAFLGTDLQCG